MAGSSKTTYAADAVLNMYLRGVTYSAPATAYIALFTSDPGETGTGAEVSGGSYARQPLTFSSPASAGTTGRKCTTTADAVFPAATSAWGTVTHAGIFDSLNGGNVLYYAPLTTPRNVIAGDQFNFKTGNISVTED